MLTKLVVQFDSIGDWKFCSLDIRCHFPWVDENVCSVHSPQNFATRVALHSMPRARNIFSRRSSPKVTASHERSVWFLCWAGCLKPSLITTWCPPPVNSLETRQPHKSAQIRLFFAFVFTPTFLRSASNSILTYSIYMESVGNNLSRRHALFN